ncbi:beta-lactamase-like protein [Pavlovales sp. CCMP2436]|nr:beta-lactamase-like protein [Pavlovales sp. CCMP2436]
MARRASLQILVVGALVLMLASASARAFRRRIIGWAQPRMLAAPAASASSASASALPMRREGRTAPPAKKLLGPLELVFLGTCSSSPSLSRNQQGLALRAGGDTWLFDCGEGTQRQLLYAKWRTSTISRVFVSHMHGDHVFGLPGLLCNAGSAACGPNGHHVTIVGPQGLRQWVRVALSVTYSSLGESTTYCVHELVGLDADRAYPDREEAGALAHLAPTVDAPRLPRDTYGSTPHPCERPGLDIIPDAEGIWHIPSLPSDPPMSVRAAELTHRVPTVGYVLLEDPRPGGVDASALLPLLRAEGVSLSAIASFKAGKPLSLPSGRVLDPSDFVLPATQRKLVILGDLSAAGRGMRKLAEGCDLLVHEATNAFLCVDAERLAANVLADTGDRS